jgi:asparagine synthetase B (glutamine-hydrolysing)
MRGVFSLFRGDDRHELEEQGFQVYLQLDPRVSDGLIHEDAERLFIEIGINYSTADTNEKIDACLKGDETELRRTLDGEVCQIVVSKRNGDITIVTDPYGLMPLYYNKNQSGVIIATDLKAVLGDAPKLRNLINKRSAVEYLTLHSIMDNRTLFQDVFLIPEGHIARLNQSAPADWSFHSWYTLPKRFGDKPVREWIIDVARELRGAVEKRARPGQGAFLSGGMDSRVILATIPPDIRSKMKALTFGVEGADDCEIAKKMAKHLDIDLVHVVLEAKHFLSDALKHMWISDGASNHVVSAILHAVEKADVPALFDGTPGDANFGGGYSTNVDDLLDDTWPTTPAQYILSWLQYKGIARKLENVSHVLSSTTRDEVKQIIRDGIEDELKWLPEDMTPICRMESALYKIRVRRNTMGGQYSVDSIAASLKPYYDVGLHETFLRIPAEERKNHLFFNRYVRAVMPEILKVPTNRALPLERMDVIKRKILRYVRAIGRRLGLRLFTKRPWMQTSNLMKENLEYREWILELLNDERTRLRGIIDVDSTVSLLNKHVPGIIDYSILLVNIIDLELVLRLFSDGDGFTLFGGA